MKRKLICLALCALLLGALAACGEKAPAASGAAETAVPAGTGAPAETAAPESTAVPAENAAGSFSDAYMQFWSIYGAVWDEVSQRLEANNAALAAADPQNYYLDPSYLVLVYAPFNTVGPAVGSALGENTLSAAQELIRSYWPDAVFTRVGENSYKADYTYTELPEYGGATHAGTCTWEFDPATGSFRVVGYTDGAVSEFTEFIPQGNDVYLLYTREDKALVTYADGQVTALLHAHMIDEAPLGDFAGDVRLNSLAQYDFYPDGKAESAWISDDANAQYVITIADGEMTYAGKLAKDVLSADGTTKTGVQWTDGEPFTLQK